MRRFFSVATVMVVAACAAPPPPELAQPLPPLAVVDAARTAVVNGRLEVAGLLIGVRVDRARAYSTGMEWSVEEPRRAALVDLMARLRPQETAMQDVLTALNQPAVTADQVQVLLGQARAAASYYQAMRPRLMALIGE